MMEKLNIFELKFCFCDKITDKSIVPVLDNLLETIHTLTLHFSNCIHITDISMIMLS